jgi:hypothetical protein
MPEQPKQSTRRDEFKLALTSLQASVSVRPGLHQRAWFTELCEHVNLGKFTLDSDLQSQIVLVMMPKTKQTKKLQLTE